MMMMKTTAVVLLVLLCSWLSVGVEAQIGEPIVSAKNEVDEKDLACAACLAIVDIIDKHMEKKSFDGVESRLYEVMESICIQKNFPAYDFIPPKMVEACKTFVDKNDDEELMAVFERYYSASKRPDRSLLERKLCLNLTGDCVGNKRVATKEKKSMEEKLSDAAKLDKNFDVNVDDILKEHGHKLKEPKPVKHNEL